VAIRAKSHTLTTTPAKLGHASKVVRNVWISNQSGSTIRIKGVDDLAVSADHFDIPTGTIFGPIEIDSDLFGYVASGTADITVLEVL